jgi:hypothetical protein
MRSTETLTFLSGLKVTVSYAADNTEENRLGFAGVYHPCTGRMTRHSLRNVRWFAYAGSIGVRFKHNDC